MASLTKGCHEQGVSVGIESQKRGMYGLQYHPEVMHSERGNQTLQHFLSKIARLQPDWKMENILEEELEKIRRVVSSDFPLHKCCKILHQGCKISSSARLAHLDVSLKAKLQVAHTIV